MRRKLDILCIENDPADIEAVSNYGQILDWTVTFARDCTDGFRWASERAFDLIVANQDLPDCDGIELAREIRDSDGPNKATPLVLNTLYISERIRSDAIVAEVDSVVQRPLLFSEFKAELLRVVAH